MAKDSKSKANKRVTAKSGMKSLAAQPSAAKKKADKKQVSAAAKKKASTSKQKVKADNKVSKKQVTLEKSSKSKATSRTSTKAASVSSSKAKGSKSSVKSLSAKNQLGTKTKESSKKVIVKKTSSVADKKVIVKQSKSPKKLLRKSADNKVLTQAEKDAINKSKKDKLKEIAQREEQSTSNLTPQMIATPTEAMLKPFREAAKKNQELQKNKNKSSKKSSFIAKPPKGGKKYAMDLRVHSPVSEGYFSTGGIDPAAAMIRLAKSKGLDVIAITDYNSADFVDLVKNEAKETSVTVLPGVDLQCSVGNCNEVSFVALFPEEYSSKELNEILKELGIPETAKGRKTFTLREELKKVIQVVESRGGVLIPTRLDTTPHRVIAVKELVEKHGFHAFDLVHPENPEYFKENWPSGEFTFLSSSNANALGQIGSRNMQLRMSSPGFSGLKNLVSRRS